MHQREEFLTTIDEILAASTADERVVALLMIKLKQFKNINTTYGIEIGDELLRRVEQRLNHVMRPVDQLCRMGDSEYCILLPSLKNSGHAVLAANRIIEEFQQPFNFGSSVIQPRLVIGISVYDSPEMTHREMLQNATKALVAAEKGNEDYSLYITPSDNNLPPSLILENEMHQAFDQEEFSLYYQPKIDLVNNRLQGAEALLRWFSPKYGAVDTQYFINILEGSNLLMPITKWVLNAALRKCVEWKKIDPSFSIAVNLSPTLLTSHEIVDIAVAAVKIWDIEPSSLILEITEGAMMDDPDLCMDIVRKLHLAGIGISIDDFGTGYSSLSYLKNLPAHELKIDKSFVINMLEDTRDKSIVKTAIDLAHNLDLKIIAEGIENQEILDSLVGLGCDSGQGYYIARPMPGDEFMQWAIDSPWVSNANSETSSKDNTG